jgi:hypothetical protein
MILLFSIIPLTFNIGLVVNIMANSIFVYLHLTYIIRYKYYFLQDTKVLEAALRDAEVSQKDFLQRLFPSVKATEEEKHCDWLEDFASKANKWVEEQATAAATG